MSARLRSHCMVSIRCGVRAALLALVLQVIAPVWALHSAAAAFDPFAQAPICRADGQTGHTAPDTDHSQHTTCPVCQAAMSMQAAIDTAAPAGPPLPVDHVVDAVSPHIRHFARAPPGLRARARSPPLFY